MGYSVHPRFSPGGRSYSFQEVQCLLKVSSSVLHDLVARNIAGCNYTMGYLDPQLLLFHSDLDILAAHLYFSVSPQKEPPYSRQLLSIASVDALDKSGILRENHAPNETEFEEVISTNDVLTALGFIEYAPEISEQAHEFWQILTGSQNGLPGVDWPTKQPFIH